MAGVTKGPEGDWHPERSLDELLRALDERSKLLKSPKRQRRLRIAARRLDAVLLTFRARMPDAAARRLTAALKSVRSAAGAARDSGLVLDLAAPRIERYPDAAKALRKVAKARAKAAVETLKKATTREKRAALIELVELLVDAAGVAPGSPDALTAPRRAAAKTVSRFRSSLDADLTVPDSLHRARRRLKEVRYALEILGPLLPAERAGVSLSRLRRRLAAMQKRLGDVGDLRIVQDYLRAAARSADTDAAHELRSIIRRADADMDRLARSLAADLHSPRTDTILAELSRYAS